MFHHVYVHSIIDNPAMNSRVYVNVLSRTSNLCYFIGKTKYIKSANPVWDEKMERPFLVPFFMSQEIIFDMMKHNLIMKDEKISTCIFKVGETPQNIDIDLDLNPGSLRVRVDLNAEPIQTSETPNINCALYAISTMPIIFCGNHQASGLTTFDDWKQIYQNVYRLNYRYIHKVTYHPLIPPTSESPISDNQINLSLIGAPLSFKDEKFVLDPKNPPFIIDQRQIQLQQISGGLISLGLS